MREQFRILICAVVASIFLTACGGKETVASKSARALREAQARGEAVGGSHGGHDASAQGTTTTTAIDHSTMDHSTMTGMDHSTMASQPAMAGMDHSKMNMPAGAPGMPGMDHNNMPGMQHGSAHPRQSSMAGMDHSSMPGMQHGNAQHPPSMPAMDHSNMSGMQHGTTHPGQQPAAAVNHSEMSGMQHGSTAASPARPPVTSSEIATLQPSATLTPDHLDMPSPVSVREANKAAQNIPDGDIRHIVPGQDSENPPAPQPAVRESTPPASAPAHGAHSAAQPPRAQPAAATIYTCPMHPEVTSKTPGTCPKCGMALVKKN